MAKEYETDFKDTRDKALAAADDILSNLTRYRASSAKHHLQFAFMVLRNICLAMQTPGGIHYDIYCDIFQRILTPSLQPTASTQHWTKFLELVRYFHNNLLEKNLLKESAVVLDYVRSQAHKMQSEGDYKFILPIYFQHILFQRNYENVNAATAKSEISKALLAIGDDLREMLALNGTLNFQYDDIVGEFGQWLMPRRKAANIAYINSLPPDELHQMYEAFFGLLANCKVAPKQPAQLEEECRQHLDVFFLFAQLDLDAKVQQQRPDSELALRYLHVCRRLKHLQQDKAIAYVIPLIYYYVKLLYGTAKLDGFAAKYVELCGKFSKFFADNGQMLAEKKWFIDALMIFILLKAQVHQHAMAGYKDFWQQMSTPKCYVAHFELLMACIRLAPRITADTKLLTYKCCQSVRKHLILEVAHIAFVGYGLMIQIKLPENDKGDEDSVHRCFTQIVQHCINVLDTMSCINADSKHLKLFYARYAQLTRDIKTAKQARYCLAIAKSLSKLEAKFHARDWTLLLRRIYKAADTLLGDRQHELQLQAFYMGAIVCEADNYLLYNQLTLFYANTQCVEYGWCLSELWHTATGPLKPRLNDAQRRLLFHMEMLSCLRYPAYANTALHKSLLRVAPTQYAYALTAHLGELGAETRDKLDAMWQCLERKATTAAGLTRLEQLVRGHVCTLLLQDRVEQRKKSMQFEWKECKEDKLSELMSQQEMQMVNVAQEWHFVQHARQVIDAFKAFFERADDEFISSDAALIEWEILLDDLTSTAQFLVISGYLNYATEAWLLVYRIANTIDDQINAIRALSFLCEHAEYIAEQHCPLQLRTEVECQLEKLLGTVTELQRFLRRQQTYVLTFVCQVAYYQYRIGNPTIAEALLVYVATRHAELPERVGKYDLILGTLDAVKFRIYCRQMAKMAGHDDDDDDDAHCKVSILYHIERTMDRFRNFSYISSCDSMPYVILLHTLVLEFAEYTANRLCDGILSGFLTCVLRVTLQMGLALRVVQTLTTWAFLNLQMEQIDRAQSKLKIIDLVMGVKCESTKRVGDLPKCDAAEVLGVAERTCRQPIRALESMPAVESARKMAAVEGTSPEPWEKAHALSPSLNERPLTSFFAYRNDKIGEPSEWLQWTYFAIGCVTGRLHFLVQDYKQLEDFYAAAQEWLRERSAGIVSSKYEKIKLLSLQHYINYLRSVGKYEKAQKCLLQTLDEMCASNAQLRVDSFYFIHFELLKRVTAFEVGKTGVGRTRRMLNFNASPLTVTAATIKELSVAPPTTTTTTTTASNANTEKHNDVSEKSKALELGSAKKLPLSAKQQKSVVPFTIYNSPGTQAKAENFMSARKKPPKPPSFDSDIFNLSSGDDLNVCQAIDAIDLSDTSGEETRTSPVVTGIAKKASQTTAKKKTTTSLRSTTPQREAQPKSARTAAATTSKKTKAYATRRDKPNGDAVVDLSNSFDEVNAKAPPKTKSSKKTVTVEMQLVQDFNGLNIKNASAPLKTKKPQASIDIFDDEGADVAADLSVAPKTKATRARNKEASSATPSAMPEVGTARARGRPRRAAAAAAAAASNDENSDPATKTKTTNNARRRLHQL